VLVQTRRGELRPLIPFPGGYWGYSQPGQSLVMFSVPKGPKFIGTAVRQAAADTTLYAGSRQVHLQKGFCARAQAGSRRT
jgi:hypothetical protein